jgi:NAD(P)-dependent dehydrogenase (short-subunit alcohol dehydrogenase family)
VFNRWSSADEVATAVAYLASDAASYVSGTTCLSMAAGPPSTDRRPA